VVDNLIDTGLTSIFIDLKTNRNTAGIPIGCDRKDVSKSSLKKYPIDRPNPQPGQ